MMKLLLHLFLVIQTIQLGLSQIMRIGCTDASCPSVWSCIGSTCIGKYHECAPAPFECPTDNACHNGRCVDITGCTGCLDDATEQCIYGRCVPIRTGPTRCVNYADCTNNRICVLGRCRRKRMCNTDADCLFRAGSLPYKCCHNVCMRPCLPSNPNYNCRGDSVCIDGVCVNDKWSPNAITEFKCA